MPNKDKETQPTQEQLATLAAHLAAPSDLGFDAQKIVRQAMAIWHAAGRELDKSTQTERVQKVSQGLQLSDEERAVLKTFMIGENNKPFDGWGGEGVDSDDLARVVSFKEFRKAATALNNGTRETEAVGEWWLTNPRPEGEMDLDVFYCSLSNSTPSKRQDPVGSILTLEQARDAVERARKELNDSGADSKQKGRSLTVELELKHAVAQKRLMELEVLIAEKRVADVKAGRGPRMQEKPSERLAKQILKDAEEKLKTGKTELRRYKRLVDKLEKEECALEAAARLKKWWEPGKSAGIATKLLCEYRIWRKSG